MPAYYNEIDPYAAQWLRVLIARGLIPAGSVDERSIVDVRADDIAGFDQCHFFAGIGGWPYALRLTDWRGPVWTGSCPCQPLSVAGQRKGHADKRHLWPAFHRLIAECKPATVFGEQVESKDGREWLAGIRADLEATGYAVGAADLCAPSVGAPIRRQRLYWVASAEHAIRRSFDLTGEDGRNGADGGRPEAYGVARARGQVRPLAGADGGDASTEWIQRGGQQRLQPQDGRVGQLAGTESERRRQEERPVVGRRDQGSGAPGADERSGGDGATGRLDSADSTRWLPEGEGPEGEARNEARLRRPQSGRGNGYWDAFDVLPCLDGKARRVEPGTFPLAHGVPARLGRLRGYGNAIVPQVAAEFVTAFMECRE